MVTSSLPKKEMKHFQPTFGQPQLHPLQWGLRVDRVQAGQEEGAAAGASLAAAAATHGGGRELSRVATQKNFLAQVLTWRLARVLARVSNWKGHIPAWFYFC